MPEGVLRRRNAHGMAHGDQKDPEQDPLPSMAHRSASAWRQNFHSPRWWFLTLLHLAALVGILYKLLYTVVWIIPRIEAPLEAYPAARAWVFNPLQSLQARFLDPFPQGIQEYEMTGENAFVINLDRDVLRMKTFANHNEPAYPHHIQRFPAHEWVHQDQSSSSSLRGLRKPLVRPTQPPPQNDTLAWTRLAIQESWQHKYPFLVDSVRAKNYGDAACSLSHLLVWEDYFFSNNNKKKNEPKKDGPDYLFVFEDDADLDPSLKESLTISAPYPADLIFLAAPAIKRFEVPWDQSNTPMEPFHIHKNQTGTATRVLGGYGAWGYIITKRGVDKLLKYLSKSFSPTDLSFFEAPGLQIYLPLDLWPAVHHSRTTRSTRLGNNHQP